MRISKKSQLIAAGGLAVALIAGGALGASAAVQTNGSDGPLYMWDGNTALLDDGPTVQYAWDAEIIGHPNSTDIQSAGFACPTGSTGAYTFMTATGTERAGANGWKAYSQIAIVSGGVYLPSLKPAVQLSGDVNFIKTNGGSYALGFACTSNNGLTVDAAYYRTATVTAGTGAFTLAATADVPTTPIIPPAPAGTTGDIALAPSTLDAVNGVLSLSVPAGAAATFGAPTLVNNVSTTEGTLPEFSVVDGRVVTREGWTVTTSVDAFVNSADATNTIAASQLGLEPRVVATGTTSSGAMVGATQNAGTATYPSTFAEAAAEHGVGTTVLSGDLTFVAPQHKAAGTYTSTLTVTVVSK